MIKVTNTKSKGRRFAQEWIMRYTPTSDMLQSMIMDVTKAMEGHPAHFATGATQVFRRELAAREADSGREPAF